MNLEKCYQCSVNIEISLDLKVYFSQVTCKINNLIALRSTNQIIEISARWWLIRWRGAVRLLLFSLQLSAATNQKKKEKDVGVGNI